MEGLLLGCENENENENENEKDDELRHLPDHTVSMRRASEHCQQLWQTYNEHEHEHEFEEHIITSSNSTLMTSMTSMTSTISVPLDEAQRIKSRNLPIHRQETHEEFWKNHHRRHHHPTGTATTTCTTHDYECPISQSRSMPTLDDSNSNSNNTVSPQEFREQFHHANLPCLITSSSGLLGTCFQRVNEQWRASSSSSEDDPSKSKSNIHRQWFCDNLGETTLVPLRFQTPPPSAQQQQAQQQQQPVPIISSLDEEGRAAECQTRQVTIQEWIQMLEANDKKYDHGDDHDNDEGAHTIRNSYYLKDWHLVLFLLEQQQQKQQLDNTTSAAAPLSSLSLSLLELYECPAIFQYDLLNPFLTKFTKGDYRFCYWGPKGSCTTRHSDVLHSFSWSYNVIGTKQWTFWKDATSTALSFTVRQEAGQAIFVPCTWQHEVINLEETISINHNWITTANMDKTWECLETEIQAIRKELMSWGGDLADQLEPCESMLRGCVGLDVTAFFFMLLFRLLQLLLLPLLPVIPPSEQEEKEQEELSSSSSSSCQESNPEMTRSERSFDIYQLTDMLQSIMDNDSIQLTGRLEAVLQSESLAKSSVQIAKEAVESSRSGNS